LLRELLHILDADRTSFIERRAISPKITKAPYCGSPGDVLIETALEEITLNNILMPP